MHLKWLFGLALLLAVCGAACGKPDVPVVIPTPIPNADSIRTADAKTAAAPPPGFEWLAFNPIDFNRESLPSSYFEVAANFSGQYTQTSEDAASSLRMQVWENNLLRQRRVILTFTGEAMSGGATRLEAVRFENDFYLLDSNNICTKNNQAAQDIATLTAGRLVGGFTSASPYGRKETVNDNLSYLYVFAKEDVVLNIFRETPSVIDIIGGEAWVMVDPKVISRFGVSMNLHNAKILFGQNAVTGSLQYEYNLYEIGQETNIALPNGC